MSLGLIEIDEVPAEAGVRAAMEEAGVTVSIGELESLGLSAFARAQFEDLGWL
jgi:hypothetical protein